MNEEAKSGAAKVVETLGTGDCAVGSAAATAGVGKGAVGAGVEPKGITAEDWGEAGATVVGAGAVGVLGSVEAGGDGVDGSDRTGAAIVAKGVAEFPVAATQGPETEAFGDTGLAVAGAGA